MHAYRVADCRQQAWHAHAVIRELAMPKLPSLQHPATLHCATARLMPSSLKVKSALNPSATTQHIIMASWA